MQNAKLGDGVIEVQTVGDDVLGVPRRLKFKISNKEAQIACPYGMCLIMPILLRY